MKKPIFLRLCLAMLAILAGPISSSSLEAQPTVVSCEGLGAEACAARAVRAWLALVDSGDYRQSWCAASTVIKSYHDATGWTKHLRKARSCFGKVATRQLLCTESVCNPENFPCGNYYWFVFNTTFERDCDACDCCDYKYCEAVLMRCECECGTEARWRAAHYSIE